MPRRCMRKLGIVPALILVFTGLLGEYRKLMTRDQFFKSNYAPDNTVHVPVQAAVTRPGSCLWKIQKDLNLSHNHRFQEVHKNLIYVVSAYEDRRDPQLPEVKVISLVPYSSRFTALRCRYYDGSGCFVGQERARITVGLEAQPVFCRWKPAIIHCPLPSTSAPASLSITRSKNISHPANNRLHIIDNKIINSYPGGRVGMCLNPLFDMGDDHLGELVEFLELHKMLLLDKMFVYSPYNVGAQILNALRVYEESGFVEIVPWHLPMTSNNSGAGATNNFTAEEIHTMDRGGSNNYCVKKFAQVAVYHDCIYRNMGTYNYLALYDFDEVIVPRNRRTWPEMLQHIEHRTKGEIYASYKFDGIDFCGPFVVDPSTGIRRRTTAYNRNDILRLHKSIVIPQRVIKFHVHSPVQVLSDVHAAFEVPVGVALKHHYRSAKCEQGAMATDKVLSNYEPELSQRITDMLKSLRSSDAIWRQ